MQPRQPPKKQQTTSIRFGSLEEMAHFKRWLSLLKILVLLLLPGVLGRLLTGDLWGAVNASAGPILGIFLLKDEDPHFRSCYEHLEKIWLVRECCGVHRGMTFAYTLSIFMLANAVNGLLDMYQLFMSGFDVHTVSGAMVAVCAGCEVVAFAICVRLSKVIRKPSGPVRNTIARPPPTGSQRSSSSSGGGSQPRSADPQPGSARVTSKRRRTSAPPSMYTVDATASDPAGEQHHSTTWPKEDPPTSSSEGPPKASVTRHHSVAGVLHVRSWFSRTEGAPRRHNSTLSTVVSRDVPTSSIRSDAPPTSSSRSPTLDTSDTKASEEGAQDSEKEKMVRRSTRSRIKTWFHVRSRSRSSSEDGSESRAEVGRRRRSRLLSARVRLPESP